MVRTLFLGTVLALVGFSGTASAQDRRLGDIVASWYQRYLGRQPTGAEAYQWVGNIRGGVSLPDAEGSFLGSDEYYRRNGATPTRFIVALYRDVLGRYPAREEAESHLYRFRWLGRDRATFARTFLM